MTLSLRVTPALKNRLDDAGKRAGRNLSQEAELRLAATFQNAESLDQAWTLAFGPALAVALAVIGRAVVEINRYAPFPQTWIDRPDMVDEASWAASVVFASFDSGEYLPPPPGVAQNIVGSLLHAVKDPNEAPPELRAWAAQLHAKCPEVAAALHFPPFAQAHVAADGTITAQWRDGDTVTNVEPIEVKPGQTVRGVTVRVKPPVGERDGP